MTTLVEGNCVAKKSMLIDMNFWELIKHLRRWLSNLNRANKERKKQSIESLRSVIIATRNTAIYLREISDAGKHSHSKEAKLSEQWTRLGFQLSDLGLTKLARRCEITGRYWSDPNQFDEEFLKKADISLERMEKLARQMVAEVER